MRPQQSTESALPEKRRGGAKSGSGDGLTSEEARRLLATLGSNAMPDTAMHPLRMALEKFWAPVPSMREAAIALQIVLGDYVSAAIIAVLLAFNAGLGLFQESRAQATLAALKSRLALNASVRRNGAWTILPAAELVPGDVVKLSLGGVVAADVRLTEGGVLLDQSILTGEFDTHRGGAGRPNFCRGPCAAGRGGHGSDGDRRAYKIRPDRRTGAHGACRQHPAKGGFTCRANAFGPF